MKSQWGGYYINRDSLTEFGGEEARIDFNGLDPELDGGELVDLADYEYDYEFCEDAPEPPKLEGNPFILVVQHTVLEAESKKIYWVKK